MKTLTGLILGIFFVSSINALNIQTELQDGLIDKNYESFSILNSDGKIEPNTKEAMIFNDDYMAGIITYTDPMFPTIAVKNEVEDAIRHELIAAGYDYELSGSKMLVIYSILSENGEIAGDFADENNSNVESYDVEKGTLIISILDRDSGETV